MECSLLFSEFTKRVNMEMFKEEEEFQSYASEVLNEYGTIKEVKLNYIFIGRILFEENTKKELLSLIKQFVSVQSEKKEIRRFFNDYIDNILLKQIITFSEEEPEIINTLTQCDINKLKKSSNIIDPDEFWLDNPMPLQLVLPDRARAIMNKTPLKDNQDESMVQNIMLFAVRYSCFLRIFNINKFF